MLNVTEHIHYSYAITSSGPASYSVSAVSNGSALCCTIYKIVGMVVGTCEPIG